MKENPYTQLLNVMKDVSQGENLPGIKIGKIIASPPEIQVEYNGIILDKRDVWISEYLLIGYERTAKGHIVSATQDRAGGGGYAEFASHNHDINNDYTDNIIYTDTLKPGDHVAIMPFVKEEEETTGQQFIILDKIVHL